MSDGNFNRSMLPSNSFQSGVRAGQARMQQFAQEAFKATLEQHKALVSPGVAEQLLTTFLQQLKQRGQWDILFPLDRLVFFPMDVP